MRTQRQPFALRTLALAVEAALLVGSLPAFAEDEDVAELAKPKSTVEAGVLDVSRDSRKFGEYNGLDKSGAYAIGNFRLFGGGGDDSAYRWRLFGDNLGLDTRSLGAEAGAQGRWRVTAGYDELSRHYGYDNYQTMWRGAGTTTLTLPEWYPAAATRLAVTNNANAILANWNNIQAPNAVAGTAGGGPAAIIPPAMYVFDAGTDRRRSNVGGSFLFAPGWEARAAVKHEDKDGTKVTGVNIGRFSGVSALLPEPIHSTTDQFEAAIAFANKVMNFNVGYYGSLYRNDVKLWTVENPGANNAVLGNVARLQSYPDNQMHQVNFAGGYKFTPATRLAVTGSWSRMTQNDTFIDNPAGATWVVPDTSAHAKVVQKHLLARLTSSVARDWSFVASYRIDDRDNQTPIQSFATTGGDTPGASTVFSNEPINRRLQQANLEADWRFARGQGVRAEYEWQEIKRSSTADESPFRADRTRENTLRVAYRNMLGETLTGRISYAYSERRVSEYEEGNPRPTSPPAPFPAADPLLGGFEQFFLADRDRHKVRGQLGWQPADALSIQATLDLNRDRYPTLEFGLKESRSWVAGLDAAFAASDKLTVNAFYTYEDMRMQLDSLAIARGLTTTTLVPHVSGPPCASYTNVANTLPDDYYTDPCRMWSESQHDRVHTFGLGARYRGLLAGRLDLAGELAYTRARTPISVNGGTYYSNGVPNSATANVWIAAESFPDITSELTQLRLTGTYALDKQSSIRVMYIYGRLKSSDWAYDAYANSMLGVLAVQNYLGPGITSPAYDVNVVGVSYVYRFR